MNIMNNIDSPKANPSIAPRLRSFKSSEPVIADSMIKSRDSSISHSIRTSGTRKSALKSIGFIKEPKQENSGILMDYMDQY